MSWSSKKSKIDTVMSIEEAEYYHCLRVVHNHLNANTTTGLRSTSTTEYRIIMEYLVKISKKARILELKRRHLKITVLTSYTPYPSRKIRSICACTSLKTTKKQGSIRRI
ncbi:hypothetical protein Tco_0443235 [Tanacetum coccineum]